MTIVCFSTEGLLKMKVGKLPEYLAEFTINF